MKKGTFRLLIAIAAVLAFSGTAFGAGQIILKTTVPNIPKSTCYQAGTITMEIDPETQIRMGDIIQFTTQNRTTICKQINYFLALTDVAPYAAPPAGPAMVPYASITPLPQDTDIPVAGTAGQVVFDQSPLQYTPPVGAPFGVAPARVYGFLVRGNVGQQIITLTFGYLDTTYEFQSDDSATVLRYTSTAAGIPLNSSDRFIVRLFDLKKNQGYFWKPYATNLFGTAAPDYILTDNPVTPPNENPDTEFVGGDNALCLDTLTQDYLNEFVEATPDSRPINAAAGVHDSGFKLNFSGDYRIAKILPTLEYEFAACKEQVVPRIELSAVQQGQLANCSFKFETGAGYCTPRTSNNNLIIRSVGGTFPRGADFILDMEILVNGQTGDRGVYFSGAAINAQGYYTLLDDACSIETDANKSPVAGTYYRADNVTGVPTADTDCSVATTNRFVRFRSQASRLDLNETANDDRFLGIELPTFIYDNTIINEGDVVSIRVSLSQEPCATIFNDALDIGIFGCTAVTPTTREALLFPFVTNPTSAVYDAALVVTNLSSTAGSATIHWYEADGDYFTFNTPSILGNRTWNTGQLRSFLDNNPPASSGGTGNGVPGDSAAYVIVCTPFMSDGFSFIWSLEGNSMGYIPRTTATTSGYTLPTVCR